MDPIFVGAGLNELSVVTRTILNILIYSKSTSKDLKEKIDRLKPTIDEISKVSTDPSPHGDKHFREYQSQLQDGLHLVKKMENLGSFNLYRKYRYGKKILKLEKNVNEFMLTQGMANITLDVHKLDADFKGCSQRFERLEEMGRHIMESVNGRMTRDPEYNSLMLQQMSTDQVLFEDDTNRQDSAGCSAQVPDLPHFVVGLGNLINNVKQILFQVDVDIVGIKGMGGSGKTTLALALCKDAQVRDFFHNNIVFITVSRFPNVKGLLETMWDKIIGRQRPAFQSIEDAHQQLQKNLEVRTSKPTLVVLDDVWSSSNLEDFLFEAEGYKTIITTRQNYTVPIKQSTRFYELPMLQKTDALSLFCFWAFGQPSIPEIEDEVLVKQIEAECKGLPLALKVIGSSLCGEPSMIWETAKRKLSRGEPISEYHIEGLLNCLETSIDVLDEDLRQCFLDLGAFPKGKKFSVDALLNMWVYVRGMEWEDAFVVMLELASRNLLNLTINPGGRPVSHECAYLFSQHDVMRDLAWHLASQDGITHCKRLFMPKMEDGIPRKWLTLNQSSKAQIISIYTGAMDEKQWGQINFPEAEALVLFFAASESCLPPFLQRMPKLKVLLISNYNSKRTMLNGLASLNSLTQIKSLHLERVIVPPLYDYCRSWGSLEKLSMCLCEGLGNMSGLDKGQGLNFPMLVEMNLDHCNDLEDLPLKICNLSSLQRLSVTNCHLVHKLPDDLGSLGLLRVLRLSACPSLAMLPASICKLGQLEFLDISQCSSLRDLLLEFNQLSNLEILDMRECSGLRQLPKSLGKLRSLRHVICDEETERQWQLIKANVMPQLKLDVVQECFSLDWLDD
uniref:TSA: Wollemia nobilis Ref_Wollemi_Transcript_25735_2823 transcribed RNA sequence n=1 Tax=Wollemia nobilis TaxID=56998 RepID=A0A0C9RGS0_9CONI